jgi:hypothetical protein
MKRKYPVRSLIFSNFDMGLETRHIKRKYFYMNVLSHARESEKGFQIAKSEKES